MKRWRVKKLSHRRFLLLEILIAFFLFVVAITPLLSPYVALSLVDKERSLALDLDRIAYILYCERIYPALLRDGITLSQLADEIPLHHAEEEKIFSSYRFQVVALRKTLGKAVVELILRLTPKVGRRSAHEYHFYFLVKGDLSPLAQEEEDSSPT